MSYVLLSSFIYRVHTWLAQRRRAAVVRWHCCPSARPTLAHPCLCQPLPPSPTCASTPRGLAAAAPAGPAAATASFARDAAAAKSSAAAAARASLAPTASNATEWVPAVAPDSCRYLAVASATWQQGPRTDKRRDEGAVWKSVRAHASYHYVVVHRESLVRWCSALTPANASNFPCTYGSMLHSAHSADRPALRSAQQAAPPRERGGSKHGAALAAQHAQPTFPSRSLRLTSACRHQPTASAACPCPCCLLGSCQNDRAASSTASAPAASPTCAARCTTARRGMITGGGHTAVHH